MDPPKDCANKKSPGSHLSTVPRAVGPWDDPLRDQNIIDSAMAHCVTTTFLGLDMIYIYIYIILYIIYIYSSELKLRMTYCFPKFSVEHLE